MGIMVYSLLWVMQDFVHQPYGLWSCGFQELRWELCREEIMDVWFRKSGKLNVLASLHLEAWLR